MDRHRMAELSATWGTWGTSSDIAVYFFRCGGVLLSGHCGSFPSCVRVPAYKKTCSLYGNWCPKCPNRLTFGGEGR